MSDWTILELAPTKDIVQIKKAYALQVKKYHPEEFPEEFKRLQKAYKAALCYAKIKEPEKIVEPKKIVEAEKIQEIENIHETESTKEAEQQKELQQFEGYIVRPPENYWQPFQSEEDKKNKKNNRNQEQYIRYDNLTLGEKEPIIDDGKDVSVKLSKCHFLLKQGINPVLIVNENRSLLVLEDYIKEFLSQSLVANELSAYRFMFEYEDFKPFFQMKETWCLIADFLVEMKYLQKSICAYLIFELKKHTAFAEESGFAEYFMEFFPIIDLQKWQDRFKNEVNEKDFIQDMALDFCVSAKKKLDTDGFRNRQFIFFSEEQRLVYQKYLMDKLRDEEYQKMKDHSLSKAEGMAKRLNGKKKINKDQYPVIVYGIIVVIVVMFCIFGTLKIYHIL